MNLFSRPCTTLLVVVADIVVWLFTAIHLVDTEITAIYARSAFTSHVLCPHAAISLQFDPGDPQ